MPEKALNFGVNLSNTIFHSNVVSVQCKQMFTALKTNINQYATIKKVLLSMRYDKLFRR